MFVPVPTNIAISFWQKVKNFRNRFYETQYTLIRPLCLTKKKYEVYGLHLQQSAFCFIQDLHNTS